MPSTFIRIFVLAACLLCLSTKGQDWKSLEKNGMQVEWKVEADSVFFRFAAPTNGWIALGFNTKDQLKGSSLIMACVSETTGSAEKVERIEEHYIVKPGIHQHVAELGKQSIIGNTNIHEDGGKYTMARFAIPLNYTNDERISLQASSTYYFILAYSQSDDFEHHSRMRTSVQVTL